MLKIHFVEQFYIQIKNFSSFEILETNSKTNFNFFVLKLVVTLILICIFIIISSLVFFDDYNKKPRQNTFKIYSNNNTIYKKDI